MGMSPQTPVTINTKIFTQFGVEDRHNHFFHHILVQKTTEQTFKGKCSKWIACCVQYSHGQKQHTVYWLRLNAVIVNKSRFT